MAGQQHALPTQVPESLRRGHGCCMSVLWAGWPCWQQERVRPASHYTLCSPSLSSSAGCAPVPGPGVVGPGPGGAAQGSGVEHSPHRGACGPSWLWRG